MLSRMADALYWMARNLERADNSARLIEINLMHLVEAERSSFRIPPSWRPLAADHRGRRDFSQMGGDREITKANVVVLS